MVSTGERGMDSWRAGARCAFGGSGPVNSAASAHFNTCTSSGGSAAFVCSTAASTAPGERGAFMLQVLRAKLSAVRE